MIVPEQILLRSTIAGFRDRDGRWAEWELAVDEINLAVGDLVLDQRRFGFPTETPAVIAAEV